MKQVERFDVSPVEQELAFKLWKEKNGILRILVDGDDTAWKTATIFWLQMGLAYDLLAKTGIMNRDQWQETVRKINDELFEKHGVNPSRWSLLVEKLGEYGLKKNTQAEVLDIFFDIYKIPPKFINGTEEGLAFLKKTETPVGIVTHANRDWTWRKYNWLGLDRFLKWDDVFIVDENGHKTQESWKMAMDYFRVRPENCAGAGDSPRSDINPMCNLGVRHCFLIQNEYNIWSVHQQPVNELITRGIRSVGDLRWLGREVVFRG